MFALLRLMPTDNPTLLLDRNIDELHTTDCQCLQYCVWCWNYGSLDVTINIPGAGHRGLFVREFALSSIRVSARTMLNISIYMDSLCMILSGYMAHVLVGIWVDRRSGRIVVICQNWLEYYWVHGYADMTGMLQRSICNIHRFMI